MVHKEVIHIMSQGSNIMLNLYMVHKEVIHHVNSLHGSQGSNSNSLHPVIILLILYMVHKEVIHPVNSLHGSQGSNISC